MQDALTAAIASLRIPGRGYSYEASLLTWLTQAVLNRLRDQARRPVGLPPPGNLPGNTGNKENTDEAHVLEEWRARYLLVETFFKSSKSIQRVKAIWEWMLLSIDEDCDEANDNRMADYVSKRTGEVNKNTLIGSRRRLRQRMEAIRYIRDLVSGGKPDSPGDGDLLAHIENTYGLDEKDKPTVRSLGGLVRACPPQRTLHWARLARLVIMNDPSYQNARKEAESLSPLSDLVSARLARALSNRMLDRVRHLATCSNKNRLGFLLAPCWCLAILDGLTGEEAIQRLKPASLEEAEWIKQMVYELFEGIST